MYDDQAPRPASSTSTSPGFAPYQFSWFRDGSFIADGASAARLYDEADRFHEWSARVLEGERPAVEAVLAMLEEGQQPADSDYLPARFNLDGTRHEDDWWNFQVDGYGTWLWALERHVPCPTRWPGGRAWWPSAAST